MTKYRTAFFPGRLVPKKRLGQNFLVNQKAAQRIVETLDLKENEIVLEIGCGKGALTEFLLQKNACVYGVEIDKTLVSHLQDKFATYKNFILINQDILKLEWESYFVAEKKIKIVGNIPYQITSPLLSCLIEKRNFFDLCLLMLQREVAHRICASPGTSAYSSLSVAVQFYFEPKILLTLKPTSFFPPPKVHSSIVRFKVLAKTKVQMDNEKFFFQLVKVAFGQRRKTALNAISSGLKLDKERLREIFHELKFDPKSRAETYSLEQLALLTQKLIHYTARS